MANARKKNRYPGVFRRGETWGFKVSYVDEAGRYRQQWRSDKDWTQQDAWNAKCEAISERNRGGDLTPAKTTLAQYLHRWLRDYAEGLPGAKTQGGYKSLFDHHVIPVIGNVLLRKLRPLQIQSVYTAMRRAGLSEKTILNCHRALSQALKHAVDWELASRNPATAAKKPRPAKYEPIVMPVEMIRDALQLAKTEGGVRGSLIRFAIYSGMRQGELRRLRWDHIDFEGSRLAIPKAKSAAGVRPLALTPDGLELLREHRRYQREEKLQLGPAYKDQGFVFARIDGEALSQMQCDWAWWRIRKVIGTTARFHDLRHAHASLLLKMGVHPKVVQERLGHSSIQITIDLYSHVFPGIHEAALLPLDELLGASASSRLVADESTGV